MKRRRRGQEMLFQNSSNSYRLTFSWVPLRAVKSKSIFLRVLVWQMRGHQPITAVHSKFVTVTVVILCVVFLPPVPGNWISTSWSTSTPNFATTSQKPLLETMLDKIPFMRQLLCPIAGCSLPWCMTHVCVCAKCPELIIPSFWSTTAVSARSERKFHSNPC